MDLLAPPETLGKVRYIAMDFLTKEGGGVGFLLLRNPLVLFEFLGRFEGVREFVWVLGRDKDGESDVGEFDEIEKKNEMGELKERILERVERMFKEVKGHKLEKLPKIRVVAAKGGGIDTCCCGVGF
jgi:hypothetical protein